MARRPPAWQQMLDEFALNPNPMTWDTMGTSAISVSQAEQLEALQYLLEQGYVARAGVRREQWTDTLYAITPAGTEVWKSKIKGVRRRPASAPPVPKFSTAQVAAAMAPRDVFDLTRVPWRWERAAEPVETDEPVRAYMPWRRPKRVVIWTRLPAPKSTAVVPDLGWRAPS